jgi:cytochrome c oxidase subunit 3
MATIAHGHEHEDMPVHVHHQFENIDQQNESYLVGMWTFLGTEVMFFGALFLTYVIYRWNYQQDFFLAHEELSQTSADSLIGWVNNLFHAERFPTWGSINTTILLFSSFTMVMAVRAAQIRNKTQVLRFLGITVVCACIFLAIKFTFEWPHKFHENLYPGVGFGSNIEALHGANPRAAQIFFSLYFGMTGLHAIHIIAGIGVILALMYLWKKGAKSVTEDFTGTEMVGLYWHFVDLVWIFLFPLFYLIPG